MSIAFSPQFPFCYCSPLPEVTGFGSLYPFKTDIFKVLRWFWRVKSWRITGSMHQVFEAESGETITVDLECDVVLSLEEKNITGMQDMVCCPDCHSWSKLVAVEGTQTIDNGVDEPVVTPVTEAFITFELMSSDYIDGCSLANSGNINYYPKLNFIFSGGLGGTFISSYTFDDPEFVQVGNLVFPAETIPIYDVLSEGETIECAFSIQENELWPIP